MVGFHSQPVIPTVAAATVIDSGGEMTSIRAIMVHGGTTLVLREKDVAGAIRFQATAPAGISLYFDCPIMFPGNVYSSATGADLYP